MSDPRILTVRPRPDECVPHVPARLFQRQVRDYGFSELDAYQFATQTVESPLANVCDTNYTCVAKPRKQWLPERETHRGLHAPLRETAATLRG